MAADIFPVVQLSGSAEDVTLILSSPPNLGLVRFIIIYLRYVDQWPLA